ncbi:MULTISPECIES: hypothetical protein [unclassified Paenibacillus]|nr:MULTISPECIES: hypothetical protein [unclassified Paenibacillus]MDQ0896371.1 hypothetical protein [Paenibacillus sp. V4I7]MDQ0914085.1 hypothetical protein [Paenibacillus sp. V4I5]
MNNTVVRSDRISGTEQIFSKLSHSVKISGLIGIVTHGISVSFNELLARD